MCNSFSSRNLFWLVLSMWVCETEQEKTIRLFPTRFIRSRCAFLPFYSGSVFISHWFPWARSEPFSVPLPEKIWYNCFVRLLHFALHNCQVENYLVSGVLGYWIKTKHEREGKKKRISFAAIVSNCVMWHTQWTITHNFFLTEYNYSALLFSFHLIPSQSLSVSHQPTMQTETLECLFDHLYFHLCFPTFTSNERSENGILCILWSIWMLSNELYSI